MLKNGELHAAEEVMIGPIENPPRHLQKRGRVKQPYYVLDNLQLLVGNLEPLIESRHQIPAETLAR